MLQKACEVSQAAADGGGGVCGWWWCVGCVWVGVLICLWGGGGYPDDNVRRQEGEEAVEDFHRTTAQLFVTQRDV
eukprot:COSAG04_NODE_6087_length_1414_cov_516.456274_1_plen_74_part_10